MTLTKGQREVLQKMATGPESEEAELVYEDGQCYLGYDHIDSRILFGLLRLCAISLDQYSKVGGLERYRINSTGKDLLALTQKENKA